MVPVYYSTNRKFERSVGRGCTWHKGFQYELKQSFVLIFDEDIDLRVLARIPRALKLIHQYGLSLLMIGERKGSLTLLLNEMPSEKEKQRIKEGLEYDLDEFNDTDKWVISINSLETSSKFLQEIAHPAMPEAVLKYLLDRREEPVVINV